MPEYELTPYHRSLLALHRSVGRTYGHMPEFEDFFSMEQGTGFYDWLAGALNTSTKNLYDVVAYEHNIPIFPIYSTTSALSKTAESVWEYYKKRYGQYRERASDDMLPWLPICSVGPLLVMGHYLPDSTDFQDVPQTFIVKVLVEESQYREMEKIVVAKEGSIEYLEPEPTPKPLERDAALLDIVRYISFFGFCSGEDQEKLTYILESEDPTANAKEEALPKGYDMVMAKLRRGLRIFPINEISVNTDLVSMLPAATQDRFMVVPFYRGGRKLYLATPNITSWELDDAIYNDLLSTEDVQIAKFYASPHLVQSALESAKARSGASIGDLGEKARGALSQQTAAQILVLDEAYFQDTANQDSAQAIQNIVYRMLYLAVIQRASDVHIEPYKESARFRFRLDGVLQTVLEVDLALLPNIVSKIKILSQLDIGQRRLPQDGRITIKVRDRLVDFRVSILPVKSGTAEKLTLRIIDKSVTISSMADLRLPPYQQQLFLEALEQDKGMVLVTGPTGSGKSSTLYALLNQLNDGQRNIQTIEDPIELELEGLNQTATNNQIGLTFSEMLKRIMRADPDVIMVGEIRDLETADAAVQASLTGHLVFSTLHTNDAIRSVSRMHNMGVESYLLSDSLLLLQAQRLVRTLCKCHGELPLTDDEYTLFDRYRIEVPPGVKEVCIPGKCPECSQTGYRGRVAVMEVIPVGETLRELIARKASFAEILECVQRDPNLFTMYQEGLKRVLQKTTTLEEISPLRAAFN